MKVGWLWQGVLSLGIVAMMVGMYVSFRLYVSGEYEMIEHQQMEEDLLLAEKSYLSLLNSLGAFVADWAAWDDTYDFVQSNDENYVITNLHDEAMMAAQIDVVAVVNNSMEMVLVKEVDGEIGTEIMPSRQLIQLLQTNTQTFHFHEPHERRLGLLRDENGKILLLAAYPILPSSREGSVMGTLLMGRYIEESDIYSGRDWSVELLPSGVDGGILIEDKIDNFVSGSVAVDGFLPDDYYQLAINRPELLVSQGEKTLLNYFVSMSLVGMLLFLVTSYLVNKLILQPFSHLEFDLRDIANDGGSSRLIRVGGPVEFRRVASGINSILGESRELSVKELKAKELTEQRMREIEQKNDELEKTKLAMLNILEDQRELEEKLIEEKAGVEAKVVERTKQLAYEQAKLKGSINNLPVGFILVDQKGTLLMVNAAAKKITQIDDENSIVNQVREWLIQHQVMTQEDTSVLPELLVSLPEVLVGSIYLSLTVVPITVDSEKTIDKVGWVVLINDITEAKAVEKSRNEFFNIASHELRTPLTAIRGNTAMIRDYFPEAMKDDSLKQSVDDIHSASIRLIQIVNDFLDASRLELDKIKYKIEKFDLMSVMNKVVEALQPTVEEQGISLKLDCDPQKQLMVKADVSRVEQILYNLLGNAIKFTKEGEVTLSVEEDERVIRIKVRDTGVGIPLANHSLLFRKFQQAGESVYTRDASQGSGMGLYIARLLARAMKGDIKLEWSEPGKGSEFVLELVKEIQDEV